MNIPFDLWAEASGGYVVDNLGQLWRITGFIDSPAVCLEPVYEAPAILGSAPDNRMPRTVVMGSPHSEDFTRLVPEK